MTDISLKKIMIGNSTADIIKENGGSVKDFKVYYDGTFKLSQERLDSVMKGLKEGATPAIDIYRDYSIMNGRHRVAAAILLGMETIKANIWK